MKIDLELVDIPASADEVSLAVDDPDVARAVELLAGRTVWHVNTTSRGGGVAELLYNTIRHHRDSGIDARWVVVSAEEPFFEITKQLHHRFHGSPGDGRPLTAEDQALYTKVTDMQGAQLAELVAAGDVVVLHDPQPLGMVHRLREHGARVLWRSHIGTATQSGPVEEAWDFLRPHLESVDRYAFSSAAYAPGFLDETKVDLIHPSINIHSTKCATMDDRRVHEVMSSIGLEPPAPNAVDDDVAEITRVIQDESLPQDADVLLQLSRWDPLKDMAGVLRAFESSIAERCDARLVLAGPDPDDIPDDPENAAVMKAVLDARTQMAPDVRRRTHLVIISLRDLERNAVVVNALQRRATVISQKSLQEGFGLAVTEAMWKRRPVVASAVGGINEQIRHRVDGLLVDDAGDLDEYADLVCELFADEPLRNRLVDSAHQRASSLFVSDREMTSYARFYLQALERTTT